MRALLGVAKGTAGGWRRIEVGILVVIGGLASLANIGTGAVSIVAVGTVPSLLWPRVDHRGGPIEERSALDTEIR